MDRLQLLDFIIDNKFHDEINTGRSQNFEFQYISSLFDVIVEGKESGDRTGTGTLRSETGHRFVISNKTIPLLRAKLVNPHNALTEVIWILTGRTDLKWLKDNGVNYWDQWAKPDGTFGPIYGEQMRNQAGFDQLVYVINKLRKSSESRQTLINLWHGADLEKMALPPCHYSYHPLIVGDTLHLHCGQRSSDSFIGVPYDFMLFYFIQQILCYFTNSKPGNIVHTNNDYHIYQNHFDSISKYFVNYFENPEEKDLKTQITLDLQFPIKSEYLYGNDEITSDDLNQWLEKFYELNKNFTTNYSDKNLRYGMIKTEVAV